MAELSARHVDNPSWVVPVLAGQKVGGYFCLPSNNAAWLPGVAPWQFYAPPASCFALLTTILVPVVLPLLLCQLLAWAMHLLLPLQLAHVLVVLLLALLLVVLCLLLVEHLLDVQCSPQVLLAVQQCASARTNPRRGCLLLLLVVLRCHLLGDPAAAGGLGHVCWCGLLAAIWPVPAAAEDPADVPVMQICTSHNRHVK